MIQVLADNEEVWSEIERLVQANVPLGLNLKSIRILQPDQLKLLFNLRLDASEAKVWRLTDGSMNLKKMTEQFQIPIQKVQQIAFRLIVVDLVEELPDIDAGIMNIADSESAIDGDTSGQAIISSERTEISNSFLQSLVGFVQHKA